MTIIVLVLLIGLAAANGSNDVPKGVATLAGAGVTKYRPAILWGTVTTLVGCLVSLQLADRMTALFSNGIVAAAPTAAFTVAVLVGTTSWVAMATVFRLPVSTTHALVGSLLGAGMLFAASSVQWKALLPKVVYPLLLSVAVAYAASIVLALLSVAIPRLLGRPARDSALTGSAASTTTVTREAAVRTRSRTDRVLSAAHWASSGLASFARGLNDAPKIVAVGAFALVPAGMSVFEVLLVVTVAMAVGSVVGGLRVAKRLATDVVTMSHREGFTANLTTSVLVGLGAGAGLPMSTTHVSTGAIAGSAGLSVSRINTGTIRDFAIAWLCTPVVAGGVAAICFLVLP